MAEGATPGTGEPMEYARAEEAAEREATAETTKGRSRGRRSRAATADDASVALPEPASGLVATAARPANISMRQGGLREATADAIDVRQGGIGRASATDVRVSMGGVGMARAESVSVQMGGIGAAFGGRIEIQQGGTRAAVAREARFGQAFVQTLVANEVVVEQPSAVLFLVARRASGNIRVLFDWRGALAFGAAFGVVMGLLQRRRGEP